MKKQKLRPFKNSVWRFNMTKFKKLLTVAIGGYIFIIMCMMLMFMRGSSNTLRIVLFTAHIVMLIYDVFLLYYFLVHVKNGKK